MPWHNRLVELRSEGHTAHECAVQLTAEGFIAKQGGPIHADTVSQYCYNHGLSKLPRARIGDGRQQRFQPKTESSSIKTFEYCMFCGKAADHGDHAVCRNRIDQFRADLRSVPADDAWRVFQAAENGRYGRIE